jgi:ribosomal protein S27E
MVPEGHPHLTKNEENTMTTPKHCPGFESHKHLKSFICTCPDCGKEKEIFSDEFDKTHSCSGCGSPIDFSQCKLDGEA